MHDGKLICAPVMEPMPMHTFQRCVERSGGDRRARSFSCADQLRCMAFAQLTSRESLRDIETCLRAQSEKLYHMGLRGGIARATLTDANEARDWRIHADFAQTAVTTQIWIAVAVCVRVAILKKRLHVEASPHTILPIPSITVFENMPRDQVLLQTQPQIHDHPDGNRLNLFS